MLAAAAAEIFDIYRRRLKREITNLKLMWLKFEAHSLDIRPSEVTVRSHAQ